MFGLLQKAPLTVPQGFTCESRLGATDKGIAALVEAEQSVSIF